MSMALPTVDGVDAADFKRRWRVARRRAQAEGLAGLYVTSGSTFHLAQRLRALSGWAAGRVSSVTLAAYDSESADALYYLGHVLRGARFETAP